MGTTVKSRSDLTIILLFFGALAVMGIFAGGFVVRDYAQARASESWPSTTGIVLSQLDGATKDVRYVYSINGRSYEASRKRTLLASVFVADSVDYLPGENVSVYVNPQNPDYSVLYPGGGAAAFVLFSILSGGCVFFGIGGIVWAFSKTADLGLLTFMEAF